MKRLLLLCCLMMWTLAIIAQPNIAGRNTRIKLADAIAEHQQLRVDDEKQSVLFPWSAQLSSAMEKDEKDYHFQRWLAYWKQHTDSNGYLVSPAKTFEQWQKVRESKSRSAGKTTTGVSPSWVFQGPDSSGGDGDGVGRINVIAFHPTDSNTYFVGSPGGGVWKTINNGLSWTSLTDQLPLLSISDIVVNPLNPNTIYICTGDREAGDYSGIGVLKTCDGGANWNITGMAWSASLYNIANSMVINPQDTNSLILATSAGMYRSYDGGNSFSLVAAGNFNQVLYCPNDTNIAYATNFLNTGVYPYAYAQIWRSVDGGTTWSQQTHFTTTDRVTIAVTPAAPNIVMGIGSVSYTSTAGNADGLDGVYKSSDYGGTFTQIFTGNCGGNNLLSHDPTGVGCGGQGWYDLPLAMSPTDSNAIFAGGIHSWGSNDGGYNWHLVNEGFYQLTGLTITHCDKHWMAFNPLTPNRFFETNDGGIYSSYNPVANGVWNNLTNRLGIEEIYRTSVSNVAGFAIAGAQDNGSKIVRNGGFYTDAADGDGMTCALDFADSTVAYASYQTGYIFRLDPTIADPASAAVDISANIISGTIEGTGAWTTPFVLQPACHKCILAGYNAVYQSTDQGNSWSPYSPQLTSTNLWRIATTAGDPNTVFATENAHSQNIYYTNDGGGTWNSMTAPYPGSQFISDIKIDPRDKDHIWVTYSGYGSPRFAEWYAATGWHLLNTGLPDVPVLCLAVDFISRDMYAGTELGVYYRDSAMASWQPYTTGMPSVEVTDIDINYATNEIWASTFGRSLWKSPKHTTTVLQSAVMSVVPFTKNGVIISPNPNHGIFNATVTHIADKRITMHVINSMGTMVWQGTGDIKGGQLEVNVPGLTAGIYLFEIISDKGVEGRQTMAVY